jgi:hypothetical protein
MRMKKTWLAIILTVLTLSACNKFTDITPKGKSLILTQEDLERLANKQYNGSAFEFRRMSVLINEMYPQAVNIPNLINGTNKNLNYAMVTYDESIDRFTLALTDGTYDGLYSIITNVASTLVDMSDKVTGDPVALSRLKAEGLVIRAFMHYYLVNIYAKAYDPATAATDGGVPYVTDMDFGKVNEKITVKEVYEKMLADINAAIALNVLPDAPKNNMRVGKGLAHAIKAKILLSMRDYPGALEAVNVSLGLKNTLEDQRPLLAPPTGTSVPFVGFRTGLNAPDNIFYAYTSATWPFLISPTYEMVNGIFEPGNILKDLTGIQAYRTTNSVGLTGIPEFNGSYPQNSGGITTSDLYLLKAECLIRTGQINAGMDLINQMRVRRISPYTALTSTSDTDAMAKLQRFARVELLYSGKSYFDIKRWNREGKYPVSMQKILLGKTYTLSASSPLWVFPFPQSATQFNSTLTQNY